MARIAIIGGHGQIALLAAKLLVARGDEVTSIFRNPEHEADIVTVGATPLVLDIASADTGQIAGVLAGHDAVIWSAGAGGGSPERTYAVDRDAAIRSMTAATTATVKRYIMVSYFNAGAGHQIAETNAFYAYAESKAAADDALRASTLDWTILGPSTLTSAEPTGRIQVGSDLRSGSVSRADVAAAIVAVLHEPSTIGRMINFNSGDTPISEAIRAS